MQLLLSIKYAFIRFFIYICTDLLHELLKLINANMIKNYTLKQPLILFFLSLLLSYAASAQIGIGTTTPNSRSILDVTSSTQGILVPRLTTAQLNAIVSPPQSLMVYNTDVDLFYYFSTANSAWIPVNTGSVVNIPGTTYTLSTTDNGRIIDCSAATAVTITVPNTLPTGFQVSITQSGVGAVTLAASGGMVINNRWGGTATSGRWAKIGLEVRATNSAVLSGDVR